jgi:hypothetical protein
MLKSLNLPKGAREELGMTGDCMEPVEEEDQKKNGEDSDDEATIAARASDLADKKMRYKLFKDGHYYLIPSFFRTLMYLKKQKKEFAISFRTFGVDLEDVVYEFDKFCKGEHPCYNGRNNMP